MRISLTNQPFTLDALGLRCPMPVQRVRKALKSMDKGQTLHLLGDDPESLHDIPALLARLNISEARILEQEIGWLFIINI